MAACGDVGARGAWWQPSELAVAEPESDGVEIRWDDASNCFRVIFSAPAPQHGPPPGKVGSQPQGQASEDIRGAGPHDSSADGGFGQVPAPKDLDASSNHDSGGGDHATSSLPRSEQGGGGTSTGGSSTADCVVACQDLCASSAKMPPTSEPQEGFVANPGRSKASKGRAAPDRLVAEIVDGIGRLGTIGQCPEASGDDKGKLLLALCGAVEALADWRWPDTAAPAIAARSESTLRATADVDGGARPRPQALPLPPAKRACRQRAKSGAIQDGPAAAAPAVSASPFTSAAPPAETADGVASAASAESNPRSTEDSHPDGGKIDGPGDGNVGVGGSKDALDQPRAACSSLAIRAESSPFPFQGGDVAEDLDQWVDRKMAALPRALKRAQISSH